MPLVEINFDGIVGPTHNYAGLSLGNLAATAHAGDVSYPRAAALQGLAKMRANAALGLPQGFFVPLPRPNPSLLAALGDPDDRALIAAGAFHNDVVAVANERVLFAHEQAFAEPEALFAAIRAALPEAEIVVVPASAVSLEEAVHSYLFNAQLVTLPDGAMALIVPEEARASPAVRAWLDDMLAGNGPIRQVIPVDVRQSMANGGGPACLRLRVVADPATVDPRFLLDEAKAKVLARVIERRWPEQIDPGDVGSEMLSRQVVDARAALLQTLGLLELA